MHSSVRDALPDYLLDHEGRGTNYLYADTLNLVTTGVGNLVDFGPRNSTAISAQAMAPALALPWKHPDGSRASREEIAEAWTRVKLAGYSQSGGGPTGPYPRLTTIRLDEEGMVSLYETALASAETQLRKDFPNWDDLPADAQMAMLIMAWAMGSAFRYGGEKGFPKFGRAIDAQDFDTAAEESFFNVQGGGTKDSRSGRNADIAVMFANAADAVKGGVDRGQLFFSGSAPSSHRVFPRSVASVSGSAVNPWIGGIGGALIIAGGAFMAWDQKRKRK